jgi:glycosyltransferase involved in cell wall biosynthesis
MKRHVRAARLTSFYIGSRGESDETSTQVAWRLLRAPLALARRALMERPDLVHLNPSFDLKSMVRDCLLLLALRAVGFRRVLFYVHGFDMALQTRIAGNPVLRPLVAWVLNRAARITVLGEPFRAALIALGVDAARVEVTRTMFEGNGLRAVEGEPPASARRSILFMSRFDREKGARELIAAFRALAKDYPDVDLIMAGEGADTPYLQAAAQQIASRVFFPGYVGGGQKWRLLRDCTIFALPTYYRSEGMPVAVLEAMGAGKPLLVGPAGSLKAIVADGENGVALSEVTPQTVEAGLRRLLDAPGFAEVAGRRNADIAWTRYEAHAVTAEIEKLYQKVASC